MAISLHRVNWMAHFFHYLPFNFTELRFYLQHIENERVHLCISNITYGCVCVCVSDTRLCDHVMWYEKSNTFARFARNGKFFELSVTFVFDTFWCIRWHLSFLNWKYFTRFTCDFIRQWNRIRHFDVVYILIHVALHAFLYFNQPNTVYISNIQIKYICVRWFYKP